MSIKSRDRNLNKSLVNEVLAVVLAAAAVLLLLSLITYDPKDPSWNTSGPQQDPSNLIGVLGAYISDFFLQLFGLASLAIPALMAYIAYRTFFTERLELPLKKAAGSSLLLAALSGFLALFPRIGTGMMEHLHNGGAVGQVVEGALTGLMGVVGAAIILTVASMLTLMLTMEVSLAEVSRWLRFREDGRREAVKQGPSMLQRLSAWWTERAARRKELDEQRRLERAEKQRQKEEERILREREAQSRAESEREQKAEERRKKQQEKRPVAQPVITTAATSSAAHATEMFEAAIVEPAPASIAADEPGPVASEPARAPSLSRREAAAALRAYAAKNEQAKAAASSAQSRAAEITMDPDVAEMISTASIVRTAPTEKADLAKGAAKDQASRRRSQANLPAAGYAMPSLDLLETPIGHQEQAEDELRDRASILAEKCKEFSVTGHIHRINPGPVVTTFEFKPDPGIKYSRVVSLAEDLCLALKAESIRIDRIPGKSTVGIEVPNLHRAKIFLRDVVESSKFQSSDSKLTIALGKTINGEEYVADLARMPHLLIAGATGAGKSVTLNSIICSVLYKATPEEVKFIMVDPKRVELGLYENIPHLLTPIVTDPKRAANALKWAVNEMENRYRELAKLGVRNIEQYNRQVREMTHPTLSEDNPEAPRPLPYIVIAIDELADLMMIARGEVETSIARLAQMARAVGIHLILATQRPSVDIITGVIKANIPSRIAFRVSSKVDSRTIVDANGAEALLGQGDMLFLPPGTARLIRVHGSFVNEAEIKRICDHARQEAKPDFNEQVTLSEQEVEGAEEFTGEHDELYDQALLIVTDMARASTSVLQRRLSIGYGRAAKILDLMEREGFIGPAEGAKPRKVLQAAYEFRDRIEQRVEEQID
jgi:S-DNA-T family DNA segregation ATPase FtsK/SpoIIIE